MKRELVAEVALASEEVRIACVVLRVSLTLIEALNKALLETSTTVVGDIIREEF